MHSDATTVAEYLASLAPDRREAIAAVRDVILKNLDKGYDESMQYGMISYSVSPVAFPEGHDYDPRHPLPFAALASQKNYMSVYLMGAYSDTGNEHSNWFRKAWEAAGKKLDMGKCCVRFTKLADLAIDVLGEAIRRMPAKSYVEFHTQALALMGSVSSGTASDGKKTAATDGKKTPEPDAKKTTPADGKNTAGPAAAAKPAAKQPSKQLSKKAAKRAAKRR